jgi:hypothetical protein
MKNMINLVAAMAFANANAASRLFVCATPQNTDLTQSEYELLTWVEVKGIGSRGETGKQTNILTYDTWDTTVVQKAKGMTDAGSPPVEVARIPTDPGQIIMRAAGAVGNNNNYAFKELRSDGLVAGQGSVFYNRGLVTGPTRPGGRNEDFDLEVYTLGLQQEEIVVNPGAGGTAPAFTALPAISGTEEDGETLTLSNGTVTGDATITYQYQWFVNGVAKAGETASTLTLVTADVGKYIQGRVVATNDSGYAVGWSDATGAIGA